MEKFSKFFLQKLNEAKSKKREDSLQDYILSLGFLKAGSNSFQKGNKAIDIDGASLYLVDDDKEHKVKLSDDKLRQKLKDFAK